MTKDILWLQPQILYILNNIALFSQYTIIVQGIIIQDFIKKINYINPPAP